MFSWGSMTRFSSIVRLWTLCLLCAFCASSDAPDGPCTVMCALPQAFSVTVTSSVSGAPVPGAYVTGDPYGAGGGLCNQAPGSTCYLPGFAGTYRVQIGAPGFQSVQRSITVAEGSGSRCCPGTVPGHLDVALVPIS
jgi:hypothetical protein